MVEDKSGLLPSDLPKVSAKKLEEFQRSTFSNSGKPIREFSKALEWVEQRGFVFFWPIKDYLFPSLWSAVAGGRPVTYEDPGNITWNWKDGALGQRSWYYSKLIRRKSTILSMEVAPFFYALTNNFGDPENDHRILYDQGLLSQAANNIYEALLRNGPLNTIDLRKMAGLGSRTADSEFNRAMETLQVDMKILPIGIAEAGAWKYCFIYQIVPDHLPELPKLARAITESQARQRILSFFFNALGFATMGFTEKFFGWKSTYLDSTLASMVQESELVPCYDPKQECKGFCLPGIIA